MTPTEHISMILRINSGKMEDEILPEHTLIGDLGMDSIDLWETVMELEDGFNISIPDDRCTEIVTVKDVVGVVTELLGERDESH